MHGGLHENLFLKVAKSFIYCSGISMKLCDYYNSYIGQKGDPGIPGPKGDRGMCS